MSTYTFVDQLIGLAREFKTRQRRERRMMERKLSKAWAAEHLPAFDREVFERLIESGYFERSTAEEFAAALQRLLSASDPRRRR